MKWQNDLSNLLIAENGLLIFLADQVKEILGIREVNGRLVFKVQN